MNLAHLLSQSVPGIGALGAIVGGSAAAAKNYQAYKEGTIAPEAAVYDVSKEAAGAGVATAASAVVAGTIGSSLALTVITAVTVAAGVKYAWDRGMEIVDSQLLMKDNQVDNEIEKFSMEK